MIYKYTDETQLSAHFNVREFRCKCGRSHDIELNPDLILKLEKLYRALDCTKIIITSWNCQEMCSRGIPKIMDRQESGGVMRELL